jgi:hypothetical protein
MFLYLFCLPGDCYFFGCTLLTWGRNFPNKPFYFWSVVWIARCLTKLHAFVLDNQCVLVKKNFTSGCFIEWLI